MTLFSTVEIVVTLVIKNLNRVSCEFMFTLSGFLSVGQIESPVLFDQYTFTHKHKVKCTLLESRIMLSFTVTFDNI